MNAPTSVITLTLLTAVLLHAGSPTDPAPLHNQPVFGAPDFNFGRHAADTDLPGYAIATTTWLHQFDADFDTLAGKVRVDDFSAWVPVAPLNFGDTHLIALLGYRATRFDTSAPNMLSNDTLHAIRMPVVFLRDTPNDWIWGGMVMPAFYGDLSGSDNFSISAALGAGYSFSPTLSVLAGFYYSHGFNDDIFFPGIQFTWRPTPKWEAYLLGPIGGITYSINEDWIVSLFGQYDAPTWHVETDTLGPDRDIKVTSMRVGLKLERRFNDLCWGYLAGGWSFARELDVEALDNTPIQQDDIDAGPFLQLGLNLRY